MENNPTKIQSSLSKNHLTCLCGELNSTPYYNAGEISELFKGYQLVSCHSCGLVRTDPSPISQKQDAENLYDDPLYYAQAMNEKDFWIGKARLVLKDLKGISPNSTLLEVGCGTGWIVKAASELGFKAKGIDINRHAIELGREHFKINLERKFLNEVKEKFDVIVVNHVLEHILDPKQFLIDAHERLNLGGYLFFGLPNLNGGIPTTLRLLNKLPAGPGSNWLWIGYQPNQHIWHFTPKTIRDFLEREGWQVTKTRTNLNNAYASVPVTKLRHRFIQKIWKVYEKFHWADEMGILCQKK
ncbi:MAG: class I SAM-dependent methyltransferase [Oligoflexia bacterium]|nr:class I SAM-dependent methyltransferase [Oligoflexia bacterium]